MFPKDVLLSIYAHIRFHLGIRENFHNIHPSGVHTFCFQNPLVFWPVIFSEEKLAVISFQKRVGLFSFFFLVNWLIFFCSHIYTHLRVNFMLHIHTRLHLFEKQFHVTYSLERQFFLLLYSNFEKQFHTICSHFEKHFRAIFNIYAHWQSTWLLIPHVRFVWKVLASCYLF